MQRPREARQTQEGHNIPPREGQHNLDIPRGAETEAESSRARGYGSQLAPGEEGNGATLGGRVRNEELHHPQQGAGEQSWEHSFKSLQEELIRVKEVVRGRAPDTMDTLVQQTESPFTTEVLHFPLSENSGCHKWKHSRCHNIISFEKSHIQNLQTSPTSVKVRPNDPNTLQPSPVEKKASSLLNLVYFIKL